MKELFLTAFIFVLFSVLLTSCSFGTSEEPTSESEPSVTAVFAYNENDTAVKSNEKDEFISSFLRGDVKILSASADSDGVPELEIYNSGDSIELLEFNIISDGKTYSFKVTAFLYGETLVVGESDGAKTNGKFNIENINVKTCTYFTFTPSVNSDVFDIKADSAVINVKNISDFNTKNVYIYYKKINDGGQGAETYRINAGDISTGEVKQVSSENLTSGEYKIIFTTYEK